MAALAPLSISSPVPPSALTFWSQTIWKPSGSHYENQAWLWHQQVGKSVTARKGWDSASDHTHTGLLRGLCPNLHLLPDPDMGTESPKESPLAGVN